ncbi:MAG: tRNA preQ1(34) S-adenosylmethionine ribosyltransferase-isomerase QueA [Planctomycetota bacterium]|jgi:S-adenosylmethionine:tRNA ribosyltransferase-isomerase
MLVAEFDYELPADLIAQNPVEPRDAARLMVYDRLGGTVEHTVFSELPKFLSGGDLVVLNNTRVLPWRLVGRRRSGGRVEVLILAREGELAQGYVSPARKLRPGERVLLEDGALEMEVLGAATGPGVLQFRLAPVAGGTDLAQTLEAVGRAPLPPYVRRPDDQPDELRRADRVRYQTTFAEHPGAVAAPTAGLHFTAAVLAALAARGVGVAKVTLHVGPGTFLPVRAQEVEQHQMHVEHYHLSDDVAQKINATRARGGRIVAVGTTTTRTLETCAAADGTVAAGAGTTDLFLYPGGRPFRVVDALLTNFHLPQSTLLMLVAAFTSREKILELYQQAIERRYRFYSYGDAMLLV